MDEYYGKPVSSLLDAEEIRKFRRHAARFRAQIRQLGFELFLEEKGCQAIVSSF